MALNVRSFMYVGVKKLVPVLNDMVMVPDRTMYKGFSRRNHQYMNHISKSPVSHMLYLTKPTLPESVKGLENPDQEVATLVYFQAASSINRPRRSMAIITNNKLYIVLNWDDIYGPTIRPKFHTDRHIKKKKEPILRAVLEGSYVYYVRESTDQQEFDLVAQALTDFQQSPKTNICNLWPKK